MTFEGCAPARVRILSADETGVEVEFLEDLQSE